MHKLGVIHLPAGDRSQSYNSGQDGCSKPEVILSPVTSLHCWWHVTCSTQCIRLDSVALNQCFESATECEPMLVYD